MPSMPKNSPAPTHPGNDEESTFLTTYDRERYPKPLVMVDLVIFALIEDALQVLLIQRGEHPFKGRWALPGGALRLNQDRSLEDAARRELQEETSVTSPYLEQLATYGGPDRDPRDWSVTVAYFALIPRDQVTLEAGTDAQDARWEPVTGTGVEPDLAFDHARILADGVNRLRAKLTYTAIGVHLLPEAFTLSELQHTFELILQEKLDKSSFRQRVRQSGFFRPLAGRMRKGSNRPAQLYAFDGRRDEAHLFFPRSPVRKRD